MAGAMTSPQPVSRAHIVLLRGHQAFSGLFFEPLIVLQKWREIPGYLRNLREYRRRQGETRESFRLRARYLYPMPGERRSVAGVAKGQYFHQDLYVAREVFREHPSRHVDVGSSIAGFVSHVLSFRDIDYVDIRPLPSSVEGLNYRRGDMLDMPFADGEIEVQLSALNSPEHVGLGRYGDRVDPDAWRGVISEFQLDPVSRRAPILLGAHRDRAVRVRRAPRLRSRNHPPGVQPAQARPLRVRRRCGRLPSRYRPA